MSILVESVIAAAAVFSELSVNFEETARIATEAFSAHGKVFSADQMKWLYNDCFSLGSTVIAASVDNRKVGQIALIHQSLNIEGKERKAVLLADLFVLKKHRSKKILKELFAQVEDACGQQGVDYLLGMPNANAKPINVHFLKMAPVIKLGIRAGLSFRPASRKAMTSRLMSEMSAVEAEDIFARYDLAPDNAMIWTPSRLRSRLDTRRSPYAIHYNDRLLAISTRRVRKGVAFTLLCGFFPARGARPTAADMHEAVRQATRTQRQPFFIYAGHDEIMPALPGISLPDWARPSPMTLDLRDLHENGRQPRLVRYQLTDFDFA